MIMSNLKIGGHYYGLPGDLENVRVWIADDTYSGTSVSWFWSAAFGPFYFLRFGFYVEALVFFALAYFTFGASNLLAPIFVGGAWRRRAVKRADMKNIETVIRLTIKE